MKQGRIASIDGGKEADMFRRVIEEDLDNVCQLREIGVGHNPKVPTFRGERGYHGANHAGAVHWGFGGGHQKKRIHVDAIIFQTTIRANGTVIIDRGRLKALDDPEVRQLASQYGDPDRVLSEAL
jgi:leucyl aminopeptidase (aminopeptidase T)